MPLLERFFGPMDRLYAAHRVIGVVLVAFLGLHMVMTPIASLRDKGVNLLDARGPAILLGVIGALIIFGSVVLAMNPGIPYRRWQPFHLAVAIGFVFLTALFVVAGPQWTSLASVGGALLFLFMVIGIVSIIVRVGKCGRGGLCGVASRSIGPAGGRKHANDR